MWKWLMVLFVGLSTTVQAEKKVLAFAGTTREGSFNNKLVTEAANIARQKGLEVTLIDLKDYPLPLYAADLEKKEGMPSKAKELRKLMIQSDVIMIASPEYNGSLSALLKNVIDWSSRSETGGPSRDAFKGKTFVIMSASPGAGGGARGLNHLRGIIENIGGVVIPQQVVVPDAHQAFDDQGHLRNEKLKKEMEQLIQTAVN